MITQYVLMLMTTYKNAREYDVKEDLAEFQAR